MNSYERKIANFIERMIDVKKRDLYFYLQKVEELDGPRVTIGGRQMLIFASYSYLGLLGHPKIARAATEAIEKYGTGTHGVRILAGTTDLHIELEEKISAFKGTEAAITYSSGYVTNLATISTLCGRGDVVISDKLNHASIVDGCMLSRARFVRYEHKDTDELERALKDAQDAPGRLVVVDAVFSMDGDIVNLPRVKELAEKYDAWLMVDEAHSSGILGENGRGIEEYFGMEGEVEVKMGTLSKIIPSIGGYIAGKKDMIDYLKHNARAFIFSASLPPAAVAASIASFEVMDEEPERREKLWHNVKLFRDGLQKLGFDTMNSETPVIPVLMRSDERAQLMTQKLQQRGIFICYILPPAVPPNTSRLRATVTAAHSDEDIEQALEAFAKAGKEIGMI